MPRLPLLSLLLAVSLVSCIGLDSKFPSPDCTGSVAANFTRIYIGVPTPGRRQTGTSALDPLDGTTADKFDTILRTIAEGQFPTWGGQSRIPPQNLIVCIGPGLFRTNGQFDWVIGEGHRRSADNIGFTVEKNWRIHGHGPRQTVLQLASFVTEQFEDAAGNPFTGGSNTVIGTHSNDASGIEVSDLTIDANHDVLNRASGQPLTVNAIVMRSLEGGDWIHDVDVVQAAGDLGIRNSKYETFPVIVWGDNQDLDPAENQGSVIEGVKMTKPGRTVDADGYPGGAMTAIAVANAAAEVRNNLVDGYSIAYGGWNMQSVWFHDNIAQNNRYGFNVDSLDNFDVIFESNEIIHPFPYGIVIGGNHPQQKFSGLRILDNTIELGSSAAVGIALRGQVQDSVFAGNKVFPDASVSKPATAMWVFPSGAGVVNRSNFFQDNQFDRSLSMNFSADPDFDTDCRFGNRDLQGRPLPEFPDNSDGPAGCAAHTLLP